MSSSGHAKDPMMTNAEQMSADTTTIGGSSANLGDRAINLGPMPP